jgi:hypothetical protein
MLHKFHISLEQTIYMHEMGFYMDNVIELHMPSWEKKVSITRIC